MILLSDRLVLLRIDKRMELSKSLSITVYRGLPLNLGGVAAWTIPFLLFTYLGLNNGGYDLIERSEVGIAIWWLILVGALAGSISLPKGGWAGKAALGLLLLFAAWTALSLIWTGSAERTGTELGRVAALVGIFVLAFSAQVSRHWRAALGGVAAGATLLVLLAAISRMLPELFPAQTAGDFFPGLELERRLAYPLNYSTGLAALAAMSVPLLLNAAATAELIALRAAAAGVLPICALVLWLTGSSLAVPLLAISLIAYLLLTTDRLPQLLTVVAAGAGSAVLVAAAAQRPALDRGLTNASAISEGRELLVVTIIVVGGVALMQVAISLFARHANRPEFRGPSRRQATIASLATLGVAALAFVASPAPSAVSDAWDEFSSPTSGLDPSAPSRSAQIFDVSSRGRFQFWQSAVDAFESEPLTGIGPGTFEFYWTEHRDDTLFVRDAHSLWFESLAELGVPGLLLILGFTGLVTIATAQRALSKAYERRAGLAAVTAGGLVFTAAASVDWMWELGVLSGIFVALAGLGFAVGRTPMANTHGPAPGPKMALASLAVLGLIAVAVPLAGGEAVDRSQAAAARGLTDKALEAANDGRAVQPYAASPTLQRALVLEDAGQLDEAAAAARDAAANEPTNWRNWISLSRLEARAGNADASLDAYRRARELNPNSEFFAR